MPGAPFRDHRKNAPEDKGEQKALEPALKRKRRELDDVEKWRREQFRLLGFDTDQAYTMAVLRDPDRQGYAVDVEVVRRMRAVAASVELVWSIVV